MDRIQELLARITELSDEELTELKDLILQEFDAAGANAPEGDAAEAIEMSKLEELAEASTAVQNERARREDLKAKRTQYVSRIREFQGETQEPEPAPEQPQEPQQPQQPAETPAAPAQEPEAPNEPSEPEPEEAGVTAGAKVPEDRKPKREVARTTVIRAGADLPGYAMGIELNDSYELAKAMTRRIETMRGIRGGDGDKLIVASASLDGMPADLRLRTNEAEENLRKVQAITRPDAIVAAGGLAAPEESRYDIFGAGDTNRPVRDSLPVFTTDRGGVRFMRSPTLNDVDGVVGIWTVADDIAAATDPGTRKPAFRVAPGPEVVVDTQAITMIMTFGNLMSRAYPELVARHNDLGMIAHARVAEQQLLTQIGALSTAVTGRAQVVSATREVLLQVAQAAASYRNRHRIAPAVPMRAIMPVWFLEMLRADLAFEQAGGSLDVFAVADATISSFFSARNISITWSMDGEAGQDYASVTDGAGGLANFPDAVIWYLFVDGTFAFMDGGTLDLGLVRDSTLNAANDYQMFVETFENVVRFGHESLRVTSPLVPTGQGASSVDTLP